MWDGEYGFFDYKHNIAGYSGQDFDGIGRNVFFAFSVVSIIVLLIVFRKAKRKNIDIYLKVIGTLIPILEITKIVWVSYWDIKTGRGFDFATILPLYTCSIFIYSCVIVAFSKGRLRGVCLSWMCLFGVIGGMSNVVQNQALKLYPFFSAGAFFNMYFHYLMVFTALFLVVTGYVKIKPKDVFAAFAVNCAFSAIVIPLDYIFGWVYMQYYSAGSLPVLEDISKKFVEHGVRFLTVPLMLVTYFVFASAFAAVFIFYGKLSSKKASAS